MNFKEFLIVLGFFCFGICPQTWAVTSPEALFQQATIKETGEREPEAAIKLYQQVIDQEGATPSLIYKARSRMARCYERLGKSKEAQQVYLQIIGESASTSNDVVQEALANLRRLQNQEKAAAEAPLSGVPQKPMVVGSRFLVSRFSFLGGADLLSGNADSRSRASAALRVRILPAEAPLSLYVEAGSLIPGGNSEVAEQTKAANSQALDHGILHLQYETHLALIGELPHGRQRWVIPEGGLGVAFTSVRAEVEDSLASNPYTTSFLPTSKTVRQSINPYFSAGLHFFPDHLFSFLVQGSYIACPSPAKVQVAGQSLYSNSSGTVVSIPAHTQTFNFPSSFWDISLKLQIKFGRSKLVLEPAS